MGLLLCIGLTAIKENKDEAAKMVIWISVYCVNGG